MQKPSVFVAVTTLLTLSAVCVSAEEVNSTLLAEQQSVQEILIEPKEPQGLSIERQKSIHAYLHRVAAEAVKESDVRAYYNANRQAFTVMRVRVAHILFDADSSLKSQDIKAIRERAAQGESFEKLARTYSDDHASALKGGYLGWVDEKGRSKNVFARIAKLKAGDVSPVINTAHGQHIVKVIEGPVEHALTYDEVKDRIRFELKNKALKAEAKRLKELAKAQ